MFASMDATGLPGNWMRKASRTNNATIAWWKSPTSAAQQLADAQLKTDWPTVLGQLARHANPAHDTLFARHPMDYYWSVEQSEWASDVLFRDPADLARLYPQLVHHGIEHLSCARCLAAFSVARRRALRKSIPARRPVAKESGSSTGSMATASKCTTNRARSCVSNPRSTT